MATWLTWPKVILEKKSVWSKKMNGRSLLLSSNKLTHYFKVWTTPSSVLKIYILFLQKCDASSRSSLTVAVPKNYSFPKVTLLEKVVVPKVTLASANVYNCFSKKFTILDE